MAANKPPPEMHIGPFRFTSVGVRIDGKPTLDAWKGPLQFALWCQKAGPWWIGDLLNAGDDAFGEAFYAMCEGAVSGDQLNRYASVARRVPIRNRRPALSWSAHAAVARLDGPGQRRLLALAGEERLVERGIAGRGAEGEVRLAERLKTASRQIQTYPHQTAPCRSA